MPHPEQPHAILDSIQLGTPTNYGYEDAADAHDLPWTTSFYKTRVEGRVFAGTTNLVGDGQADAMHHGGVDKAVLAYSADHYPEWRTDLGKPEMPHGAFGENLTIAGMSEESVCIGDLFQIGAAIFEVSQPRQPCWKLARRWRMHTLTGIVVANGRTGWYLRVIEEGWIQARMAVSLVERRNPEWTIARANSILHHRNMDLALTLELAAVPKLSKAWVHELLERADRLRSAQLAT